MRLCENLLWNIIWCVFVIDIDVVISKEKILYWVLGCILNETEVIFSLLILDSYKERHFVMKVDGDFYVLEEWH